MDGMTSLADIAAVTKNGNGDGFGGGMGIWAFLIFAIIFGGRDGFFGGGNNAGATSASLTRQDVNNAVDNQTTALKLDSVTAGICDSTFALSNNMTNGFNNLNNNITNGLFGIQKDIASCCCETNRNIDTVKFQLEKGFCDVVTNANSNTRDLIINQTANTQRIVDLINNQELQKLRDEKAILQNQVTQEAQTANLIANLRPNPIPSYPVPNPYCPQPTYC